MLSSAHAKQAKGKLYPWFPNTRNFLVTQLFLSLEESAPLVSDFLFQHLFPLYAQAFVPYLSLVFVLSPLLKRLLVMVGSDRGQAVVFGCFQKQFLGADDIIRVCSPAREGRILDRSSIRECERPRQGPEFMHSVEVFNRLFVFLPAGQKN